MSDWESLTDLLAGIPDLDGSACAGRAGLFDATAGRHSTATTQKSRADLEATRATALELCRDCPALSACRSWVDGLAPSCRPAGVVAGLVLGSTGRPLRTTDRVDP